MSQNHDHNSAFRELVEAASCMIVILRPDHTIAYFNPFAERITGYSVDGVLGRDYFTLFLAEEDQEGVGERMRRLFAGGEPTRGYENAVLCRDGSHRWLAWNAELLDDYLGNPAIIAVGHDITARKETNLQLEAVLNTAVDGIVTINERGIIQSFNPAAEKIFGYTAEEAIGKNVSLLMPQPYRDEHDQYLRNYLATAQRKIIGIGRRVEARRKDGTTFPADVAVSEVSLRDRRLFTGIVRDVTEQKRAEERALQTERLAAIGQTVTGLAHESRNAFQRSQACLEMLALELEDRPDELELVARIQRALDHLHHLYEEVRDYAAPINLDRQVCNLAHVWRDAWSHLEVMRKEKEVELNDDTGDVDLSCEVDWFAIGQVFRNILENAISACPDQGKITIKCVEAKVAEQDAIEVFVFDNGPGFESGARDKVFDAFFTTKTKGTGLGMAIARRIVEAHGGTIAVGDGSPGAEIRVVLPRRLQNGSPIPP